MKKLIQNRRSAGWNLIEIIVAVAIGASIAAAGVIAYTGEVNKAVEAKAKMVVGQIATKKAQLQASVEAGEIDAPSDLNATMLGELKISGKAYPSLSELQTALGVTTVNFGSTLVDTPSITLKNGKVVSGATVAAATTSGT
jgi:prepilin-type N-terminal cleavage/methylation domain-containing protein